jgi:hypothetical protein
VAAAASFRATAAAHQQQRKHCERLLPFHAHSRALRYHIHAFSYPSMRASQDSQPGDRPDCFKCRTCREGGAPVRGSAPSHPATARSEARSGQGASVRGQPSLPCAAKSPANQARLRPEGRPVLSLSGTRLGIRSPLRRLVQGGGVRSGVGVMVVAEGRGVARACGGKGGCCSRKGEGGGACEFARPRPAPSPPPGLQSV